MNPYAPKKEWIEEYDKFTDCDLKKLSDQKMPSSECFNNFLEYLSALNMDLSDYYQSVLNSNPLLAAYRITRIIVRVITWQLYHREIIRRRFRLFKDGYHPKQVYFQYRYTKDTYDDERYHGYRVAQ